MDSLSFFVKVVEKAMQLVLLVGVVFVAVSTFKYLPNEVRKVISSLVTMLFFFAIFRDSALAFGANIPKALFSFIALFCFASITVILTYYLARVKSVFLKFKASNVDAFYKHTPPKLLREFSYTPDVCKTSFLKLSPVNLN